MEQQQTLARQALCSRTSRPEHAQGRRRAADLQLQHALLDGVLHDVAEDADRPRLAQAVDAVLRLVLGCRAG